jgi:hypothetical protein
MLFLGSFAARLCLGYVYKPGESEKIHLNFEFKKSLNLLHAKLYLEKCLSFIGTHRLEIWDTFSTGETSKLYSLKLQIKVA